MENLYQMLTSAMPLILMGVVMYFMMIRPQQQKAKQHRDLLDQLKKGDMVGTSSGISGQVQGIHGDIVDIEIAPQVVIKLEKRYISNVNSPQ